MHLHQFSTGICSAQPQSNPLLVGLHHAPAAYTRLLNFFLLRSDTQILEATKAIEAIEAIGATIEAIEATVATEVTLSSGAFDAFRVNCFNKTAKAGTTVTGVTLVSSFLRIVVSSNRGTIAFQIQANETKDASHLSGQSFSQQQLSSLQLLSHTKEL